jgi:hypothetical protein
VELYRANSYAQKYNAYVPGKAGFDVATPEERQREFNRLRKGHTTAAVVGWSLIGAAAVDGAYVAFLF